MDRKEMDGVKINIMEMWDGVKWSGLEGNGKK